GAHGMSQDFVAAFSTAYEAFTAGREVTVDGTPIESWTEMAMELRQHLKERGVATVEQLAAANEQLLQMIGAGGRDAQNRARRWLEAQNTVSTRQVKAMQGNFDALTQLVRKLAEKAGVDQSEVDAALQAAKVTPAPDAPVFHPSTITPSATDPKVATENKPGSGGALFQELQNAMRLANSFDEGKAIAKKYEAQFPEHTINVKSSGGQGSVDVALREPKTATPAKRKAA